MNSNMHPAYSPDASPIIFLVIAALIIGAAYYFLKVKKGKVGQTSRKLRIIDRIGIGSKTGLLLVEAAGQTMLLGVTPNSISTLADLSSNEEEVNEEEKPIRKPNFKEIIESNMVFHGIKKASGSNYTTDEQNANLKTVSLWDSFKERIIEFPTLENNHRA